MFGNPPTLRPMVPSFFPALKVWVLADANNEPFGPLLVAEAGSREDRGSAAWALIRWVPYYVALYTRY